ncbi:MAG: DUF333 domain-containing protein [Chloroflexota bacterium]|nr:MAG: DUF333 domain-containing protein [Chloroflexota bacterium]
MKNQMRRPTRYLLAVLGLVLSGCTVLQEWGLLGPIHTIYVPRPDENEILNEPNPASKNCEQNGYQLEIRTAGDGSQYGVCIFSDGTECEEWAYLRGECGPTPVAPVVGNQASEAARIRLAEVLGIDASEIGLISVEKINWQDNCLEFPLEGETCWMVVTPGYRVVLIAGISLYAFHTDLTGEVIRP